MKQSHHTAQTLRPGKFTFEGMRLFLRKVIAYSLILSLINTNCSWAYSGLVQFEEEELNTSHVRMLGDGRVAVIDPGTVKDDTVHNVFEDLETGENGRLIFTSPPEAEAIYNRIYNPNSLSLSGLIESEMLLPMIIGNSGGLSLEGTEFKGIHSLVLGAGSLHQTDLGMAYDIDQSALNITRTLFAPQEDIKDLSLIGRKVNITQSLLSPSERLSVTLGKHVHGISPRGSEWVENLYNENQQQGSLQPHALEIDESSTLRSKDILLESLDEDAVINSRGFLQSTDGDITIHARGDVHLNHLFANRNLTVLTTGKVTFGKDVYVGGSSNVKAGDIELNAWQSEGRLTLEAARILNVKGILKGADKVSLIGYGGVTLDGDVSSCGALTIFSKGKVQQRCSLRSDDIIRIKGETVDADGQEIASPHSLQISAKEDIKLKVSKIETSGLTRFISKQGNITTESSIFSDQSILFKAKQTTNYGKIDTKQSLNTEGNFINTKYGEIHAKNLSHLLSTLERNQGRIELEDDISLSGEKTVKGHLTTKGRFQFEGPSLTIDKISSLTAHQGTLLTTPLFTNKGAFSTLGSGLEGKINKFVNESKSKVDFSRVNADISQFTNQATGIIRTQENFDVKGINFDNAGTLFTRGLHKLNLEGSYKDTGTIYSPNLFIVNAQKVDYGKNHVSHLNDAVIQGSKEVRVHEGVPFHFYGPQYFLEVNSGENLSYDGVFTHKSCDVFPVEHYFEIFGESRKEKDRKTCLDMVHSLGLMNENWHRIKEKITGHTSKLTLKANKDLICQRAKINPDNGNISLIADGNLNTSGAQIRSGYFIGHSLTAKAKNITFLDSSFQSLFGTISVSATESGKAIRSTIHGGLQATFKAQDVGMEDSFLISPYGQGNVFAKKNADLTGSTIDGNTGSTVKSGGSISMENNHIKGYLNHIVGKTLTSKNDKSTGQTYVIMDNINITDWGIEGFLHTQGDHTEFKGNIRGDSLFSYGRDITNWADINLQDTLVIRAETLRQFNKTKARDISLEASQEYIDTPESLNEARRSLSLIAEMTDGFKGNQKSGEIASLKFRSMDLVDLLTRTEAPTIEAYLRETDVRFENGFHLNPNLTLYAKSFYNKGLFTTDGFFNGSFQGRMDNLGTMKIYGDGVFRAIDGITTGKMTTGGNINLQTDGPMVVNDFLEGENIDLFAQGIQCERGVRRVYYPGGYRDVLEDPVGMRARTGNITAQGKEWLYARASLFQANSGYVKLSAPDLYLGSQKTETDYTESKKRYHFHSHGTTNHMAEIESEKGVFLSSEASDFHKYVPRMILEGLNVHSKGPTNIHSGGTLENRTVHDTYEEQRDSSSKGGFLKRKKTTKSQNSTSTVRSNLFISTGDVTIVSEGDNHQWALHVETDGKVKVGSLQGKVFFHADKSTSFSSTNKSSKSVVWQSQSQKGHYHETGVVGRILEKGGIDIWGDQGIHVDVVGENIDVALQRYSKDPRTAWMGTLRNLPNINWQLIDEEHNRWSKKTSGLTPAASLVISLAVGIATGGVGATLTGFTGAMGSMASAGFSTLASQASVSLINNKGNIGKVLKELGSSQQIKSLATSILSAGMIHGMSSVMDLPTKAATLGEHFQDSLLRSGVSVGLSTVIEGQDVNHLLEKIATGVVSGTLGGTVANEIGQAWASGNMNPIVHKFAHGFLGATTGAILSKGKLEGALAGAMGGVISECVVGMLQDDKLPEKVLQKELEIAHLEGRTLTQEAYTKSITKALSFKADMGKLASAVTSLLTNQDVDITIKTATNAVENNFLPVAIVVGYSVGSALWTAYDIYDTYKTEGPEAALIKAGIDVSVSVVGGVVLKGAIKGGLKLTTVAAPTVEAAWLKLVAENPMIFKAVEKIASGVSNATKKVQSKISSFSQGTPLGKGPPKISQDLPVTQFHPTIFDKKIIWTAPEKGTGQTYKIFQRNDIDWKLVRTGGDKRFIGKTNLEAAKQGLTPQLKDGSFATLHHIGQNARGALVEASTRYHGIGKNGQDILHSQFGRNKPHPNFPIDRNKFTIDTKEYWRMRIFEK